MIVNMKKVTLLMGDNNKNQALESLRSLGVLHVQNITPPISEDISSLQSEISSVETALKAMELNRTDTRKKTESNPQKLVDEFHKLNTKKERLTDEMVEIIEEFHWYEKWGDIKKSDLDYLAEKGLFIKLYDCDKSVLKKLPTDQIIFNIKEDKNSVLLALITENEKDEILELKHEVIPENEFEVVSREVEVYKNQIESITKELVQMADFYDILLEYQHDLEKQLEFMEVKNGMGSKETISYLQGYCPIEKVETLQIESDKSGWGYMIEEPEETDNPPTLLKNKSWINIIQPVFDFLGTVPGYREFDISKYFLIFFSIYFAMIIGDAGYGVLFLLGAIFAHKKISQKNEPAPLAIKLFYIISIATILWGTITGNWFGAKIISGLPFLKAMTIPQLATFPELFPEMTSDPQQKIMFICFILALVQLGLANIMNFLKDFPTLKSISHLGWLSLTAGLFFLVLNLVLSMPLPSFAIILMVGGLLGVVVFGNQEKGQGFVKGLLTGLGGAFTTFLDSISSFSNIISYIRLFAVGLASVAIASSFNDIAAPLMKGMTLPAGLLILLIGHTLNIVMGMLSVIVHGIRLNVLEFSGQLGIEWSGYKYKPFKNNKIKENL